MEQHTTVLHIAAHADWAARTDVYIAPSLNKEGFIHCSTDTQVEGVANALFAGRDDLILLIVETGPLGKSVVFEDCYELGEAFPHVYGPIPLSAVSAAQPWLPDPDGVFRL